MRLDGAAPLRHDAAVDLPDSLTQLLDDGVIDDVRARLMSGKEAAVWVVERRGELIAAKVYKDREHRSFKATADYVEGPYPAALEGAVRAGERAAALLPDRPGAGPAGPGSGT